MAEIDLQPHEWRLKGTKRVKPPPTFKPQPRVPAGKPIYYSRVFSVLAWIFGIWAAAILTWAPEQMAGWKLLLIAYGPVGLMLTLMVLFDD